MRYVKPTTAMVIGLSALLLSGCAKNRVAENDKSGEIVVTSSRADPAPPVPPPPPPQVVAPPPMVTPPITPAPIARQASIEAKRLSPDGRSYAVMPPMSPQDREQYEREAVAGIKTVAAEPVSTFSVDVDTGSYANVRRFLNQGAMPPAGAVRTEEMVNYFRYDYPMPASTDQPFSVTADVATTPWNAKTRLLRIGLRGYDLDYRERPPANLVFLVDVSGSMNSADKLPLVKASLGMLADRLRADDKVSIVVYAGAAGIVLEPTADKNKVRAALDTLSAGGSTAGGQGIALAYATARANFIKGGVNRILLATDGDFNVGISDTKALEEMVAKNREDGITLTTLGFGQGNYNEALMESIADVGNGNYAYIDSATEAQKVLDDEMSSTLFTIAKDVKIQIEFNPAQVKEYRLVGYENRILREEDFNNDKVDAGDIGASHQVTAIYEIVPAGSAGWLTDRRYAANVEKPQAFSGKAAEMAFLKLRYKMPDGKTSRLIEKSLPSSLMAGASLPKGDFAFATAVAAFGQKLRGDTYLGEYSYGDMKSLAGSSNNFWRQEFVKLVQLASAQDNRTAAKAGSD